MADITRARGWVSRMDAHRDPDVLLLRQLSDQDRTRVLLAAESLPGKEEWLGGGLEGFLVIPPRNGNPARSLRLTHFRTSGQRSARLWTWFAKTASRIASGYRIDPAYAFGFLLLDDFWRDYPSVNVRIDLPSDVGIGSRVLLDVSADATEAEVLQAWRAARGALGFDAKTPKGRELRAKTISLACFVAGMVADDPVGMEPVDWDALVTLWNELCQLEKREKWAYGTQVGANVAHQFARDAKHAIEAVRGKSTPYVISGKKKRKPVNSFT